MFEGGSALREAARRWPHRAIGCPPESGHSRTCRAPTERSRRLAQAYGKLTLLLGDDPFFGAITKWSETLEGRGTADTVRGAIRVATGEPHGPVHLGLPSNLAGAVVQPSGAAASVLEAPLRIRNGRSGKNQTEELG